MILLGYEILNFDIKSRFSPASINNVHFIMPSRVVVTLGSRELIGVICKNTLFLNETKVNFIFIYVDIKIHFEFLVRIFLFLVVCFYLIQIL